MWSRYVRHSGYNDVSTRILLSLHMQVSHIRYHVPNGQTEEYRSGGATALSILTSHQLFYFQEDKILVSAQKCGRSKNPFGRDGNERNPFACQV
jgi:hypothetical protein